MTFQYAPEYEKIINFSISLCMAFESNRIPEDQLPDNEELRKAVEAAFASLVKVIQPYRNELAVFFFSDSSKLSAFTEWRLNDLKDKQQLASIETMLNYFRKMSIEDWALSVLKDYGSSSLSAESFYYELLRNPALLISYIQSLEVPDQVKLGIIRATTATEPLIKSFLRFMTAYCAKFEEEYLAFSGWMESKAEELETLLPDHFVEIMNRLSSEKHNNDGDVEVYYSSLAFQPLGAISVVPDKSIFLSIGLESKILNEVNQKEQLEVTRAFKYLDEPKHVAILKALLNGEICVMDIQDILKKEYTIPQPTLSGYLQDLFEMGAVKRHYEGVKCYYKIDPTYIDKGRAYFDMFDRLLVKGGADHEKKMAQAGDDDTSSKRN